MRASLKRAAIAAAILAGLTAVCAAVWVGAGTTGIISGVVKDAATGSPISGANVVVDGTKLTTVTDREGRYVITSVAPGDYEVSVEMVGYATVKTAGIQVTMDATSSADFSLRQEAIAEETVVVTRPTPMVTPDAVNTLNLVTAQQEPLTRLDPASVHTAPGLLGAFPGVEIDPNGSGQMHLRGGRPDQIGWYIEGIPITDPNTGMFGTNLFTTGIGKFQAYTGNYGAQYGNAISGVLNEVKKTGADVPGFNLDTEGGGQDYRSAFAEFGGGASNTFNYYAASNLLRSNLDGPVVKSQEYADNIAKLVWPSKKDTFTMLALQGSLMGNLSNTHDVGDLSQPVPEALDYMRQCYSIGAFGWSHSFSPKSFVTVRPYYMESIVAHNAMGASLGLSYLLNSWSDREGLQVDYTSQMSERHLLKFGGSMLASDNHYYMYATVPGLGVLPVYNYRANVPTRQADFYLADQVRMGKRWVLEPGLRYEQITYDRTGNAYVPGAGYSGSPVPDVSESAVTPRVGLSYAVDDRTAWKVSWGRYSKFVPSSTVQKIYFDPDNPIVPAEMIMPGLGSTDPQRSTAMELSFEKQFADSAAFRITPFKADYTNLSDILTDPNGVMTYTNLGHGEARGVEFALRKKMSHHWQGWLSYTYQTVKANRLDLGMASDMFYTSWDQRNVLSLVADCRTGRWGHGIRLDYGSGREDSGASVPALQGRASPCAIVSYNLSYTLPSHSGIGSSIYLSFYNLFDNRQTLQYRFGPGNVRIEDSYVPARFTSFGITKLF